MVSSQSVTRTWVRPAASQSRQLPGVFYLVHALSFFALRIKAERPFQRLTGIGFDAELALHIGRRRGLARRLLAAEARAGLPAGLVAGDRSRPAGRWPRTGSAGGQLPCHVDNFLAARFCARTPNTENQNR